jgi:branched-subunit amino acid transport protein
VTAVLVLLAVAAGSWVLRVAFVTVVDVDTLPAPVRQALDHVGPAVLAALIVTALAHGEGHPGLRLSLPQIAGLVAAAAVAVRTGTLLWPLVAAMGAFTATTALLAL